MEAKRIHMGLSVFIFIYLFLLFYHYFFFLETSVADVLFIQREIRLRGLKYSSNKLPNSVN